MSPDHSAPPSRPPPSAQSRDLSNAEFEELDGLLAVVAEPLEPLDAVMLDGYLCGVLVQPELVDRAAWLVKVFDFDGGALPDVAPPDDLADPAGLRVASGRPGHPWFERTRSLIERRHAALNRALAEDGWFDPLILELDEASVASESAAAKRAEIGIDLVSEPLLPWVAGFHHALVCFPALSELPDDAVHAALARLFRHLPVETEQERELVEILRSERPLATLDDGIDELVGVVADLYDLTTERRYKVETVKRELPKVGRNDPCPCGSGKKFKVCHGATPPAA